MKKLFLLGFLVWSVLSVQAQNREKRNVESFDQLSFRVPGKLLLRQGNANSVELEGPSDVLSEIETKVEGSRLVIKREGRDWGWNWSGDMKLTVYVTMKDITALSVGGSGDLIAETKINSRDLDLSVSGSGNVELEATVAGELEADVSGSGKISLKATCNNFNSDVSGSGKVVLTATVKDKANFGISGSGRIDASGSAREVKAALSGSGRVNAENMEVDNCEIRISGSGDVSIHVNKELDANISGSGSVSYKGNPNHVNSNASGSGKVRKIS